jgi:hypothetical protein
LNRESVQYTSNLPNDNFAPLVPEPSDAALAPNAPIPFTMESNHIMFNVSVNGRPPIGFILDTGADQNVINSTRLAEFGLKNYAKSTSTGGGNAAEYDYAAGATFTLPGVELRNQHVATIGKTGLERALGVKLGGILVVSQFEISGTGGQSRDVAGLTHAETPTRSEPARETDR